MKSFSAASLVAFAVLTACTSAEANQSTIGAPAGAAPTERSITVEPGAVGSEDTAAASYCAKTGGKVYIRIPEYNTNSSKPLVLAGHAAFCQYTSTTTSGSSRIHILLTTLYSTKPSLAALAYILKPPIGTCKGNPASCYCSLLGGSDQFGGASGAGGSWVNNKSEDQDLEACIFPDKSSIDSWGLTYHTEGVIRGIDLTKVMRYKYTT